MIFVKSPAMSGFFHFRNLAGAQITACEILLLPVLLLRSPYLSQPDARRAVAANPAFRHQTAPHSLSGTKCRTGVTLKKNLEKLRFANHLSP